MGGPCGTSLGLRLVVSGAPHHVVRDDVRRFASLDYAREDLAAHHLALLVLRGPRQDVLELARRTDILYAVTTADGTPLTVAVPGPRYAEVEDALRKALPSWRDTEPVTLRPRSPTVAPGHRAVLLVLYAGLCKALLFHGLEFYHTDFFSFLEMSRSLYASGELLRDNVYGHHAAIHNFYLLLAFSPLTVPLGAFGLILGLVLLHVAAVLRIALAASLDLPGHVALLGGYLSPIAFAVFDNPVFGFHPELCYPPLALLLALDLREGRSRRATWWRP